MRNQNSRALAGGLLSFVLSAGWAQAQTPAVEARTLMVDGNLGGTPHLPAGFNVTYLARFDDERAIVCRSDGPAYMGDGATITPIMVAGTQIPGQAPGVVWGGSFSTDVWPLAGRGAFFTATASGPGAGSAFAGDFDGPLYMGAPGQQFVGPATATGLRWTSVPNVGIQVGPLEGPAVTVIPATYTAPGRSQSGRISDSRRAMLNSAGALAASWTSFSGEDCLVVDANGIRVVAASGAVIQTDRGPMTVGSAVSPASQPLPDGSVYIKGYFRINNASKPALWLARPDGTNTVVAVDGDHVPGADAASTFSPGGDGFTALAANRRGSLLFSSRYSVPGGTEFAVFLRRGGNTILVARSTANRSVQIRDASGAAGLNENDDVGLLTQDAVVLYKPGVGTVDAVVRGSLLPASTGVAGPISQMGPFFGISSQTRTSGGDDDRMPYLSQDGRMFFVASTITNGGLQGSNGAYTVRITGPGCPADFNTDGFVDFFDYADFVECFEGGRCPDGRTADFNHDDFADFFDYLDFVQAFEAAC